jgi:DNA-binding response OmpR family regulator
MKARILVVEDDPRIAASVALYLRHSGFDVDTAATGGAALDRAAATRPDLVVLDVMLPEVDGLEVCRTLRAHAPLPIIMLTARATEADTLRGLDAGADDYVTKPFSPRELVARVRAVLRRAQPATGVVHAGDVEIDLARRAVRVRGRLVGLTASEFGLLTVLASSPGRAFTRAELAERAFGLDHESLDRTIDAHVMNLRRKLGARPRERSGVIVTVFGTGYRLESPARAD